MFRSVRGEATSGATFNRFLDALVEGVGLFFGAGVDASGATACVGTAVLLSCFVCFGPQNAQILHNATTAIRPKAIAPPAAFPFKVGLPESFWRLDSPVPGMLAFKNVPALPRPRLNPLGPSVVPEKPRFPKFIRSPGSILNVLRNRQAI